jgi:hypothetical protein
MRPSGHRCGSQFRRKHQPTDSLRLLTGQQWWEVIPSRKDESKVFLDGLDSSVAGCAMGTRFSRVENMPVTLKVTGLGPAVAQANRIVGEGS